MIARALLACGFLLWAIDANAHPAPFSYLDLHLDAAGVSGSLVLHDLDVAHDLDVPAADTLLEPAVAAQYRDRLVALITPRLSLTFDGQPVSITWTTLEIVADRQSLRLDFTIAGGTPPAAAPGAIGVTAYVFPYDPIHQTFVNIYEGGALRHQAILDADHRSLNYFSGSTQGRLAVIRTFVASGIQHILIGPDHILFLVGLLLLGGTLWTLGGIVTAFTIGHSITLSLAALDIVSPPSRFVEPLIALTIVVVGADNLLVLRARQAADHHASDIRAALAALFGLVHGFGFASVLKEFGLPQAALGWSLFSFNLGVEIGQLFIVVIVAGALAWLRRRSPPWASRAAAGGSVGVVLAGLFWFVQRVFFTGVR
ncbi:MAG: HupE/UreJ family protein [Vicinamibacterales bacterium]